MIRPFDITAGPLPNGTLVEASAGTGKTHAVAAYVAKALATTEDLRIGEIIVTTFTRNAVAELRERIRGRLVATARLLRGEPPPSGYRKDQLDDHLLDDEPERGSMARRLDRAAAEFDTAVIGTMHSVCARILRLAGVNAADTGDEELRDRVLDEVVNDAVVAEAQAGRHWDEKGLRDLVKLRLADPFLEMTSNPAACPADQQALLPLLPDIVTACEKRARDRMRASPSFDELLVRAWQEVTVDDADPPAERRRKQAFVAILRERYKLAIVDEAQDTNRLQWEFLHAVFPPAEGRVLFAVGDPKQAIYRFRGADVTAYVHHAQDGVPLEPGVPAMPGLPAEPPAPPKRTLSVNRRSDGPLLGGLNHVMARATFGEDIPYRTVEPAPGRDATQMVGLHPLEFLDVGGLSLAEAATRKVQELLTGHHYKPAEKRPFRPGEICVLVRTNYTGSVLAKRLVALGIPAVTEGTASVMDGQMAADIRRLLEAMERPSSTARARRAATTGFFDVALENVVGLAENEQQKIQAFIAARHATLQRKGVAAMASEIMADRDVMSRITAGEDGDRRIVDFSHVVELLNDASRGRGGHAREFLEHVSALAAQHAMADIVSRRVESDTEAVTIMTVHAAKGLQFPCVVVVDGWARKKSAGDAHVFHRDGTRFVDIGRAIPNGELDTDSKRAALEAEHDELRRIIYVAVTRPEHHVCILRTATWREGLLGDVMRDAPDSPADVPPGRATEMSVRSAMDLPEPRKHARTVATTTIGVARVRAAVEQTYLRTSYSGIVKAAMRATDSPHDPVDRGHDEVAAVAGRTAATDDGDADDTSAFKDDTASSAHDIPAAADSPAAAEPDVRGFPIAALPAGTAFGSVAHTILERVETGPTVSEDALRGDVQRVVHEVATARFLQPHRDAFAGMLSDALLTPFGGPPGAPFRDCRFADFARSDRLAEMDFEMALPALAAGVQARHVGTVLRRFLAPGDSFLGYAERLSGVGFDVPLAGLINGSIDAVLRLPVSTPDEPRLVIADYKTNRLHGRDDTSPLAAYAPARLVAAMEAHHYPLQALVYGTAIWRMLRWRMGPRKPADWDPGGCIAGVVYGFVRGMKGPMTPTDATGGRYGVFTWQPPATLWRRLSDLFAGDLSGVMT
jgi:exodeoxyribonuclease V beta subunit